MDRREFLGKSALFGAMAVIPSAASVAATMANDIGDNDAAIANPIKPPATGSIPVAFLISDGAVIIDFCGPWDVFVNVMVRGRAEHPFRPYTVAETKDPIVAGGGMKIIPDYTFDTAPSPKVLVIPAQNGASEKMMGWIRKAAQTTDVTMSVCTGAVQLAKSGLLSGLAATTHHDSYKTLAMDFPDVRVKRGVRFVDEGKFASSGGLSSGIDLAFHVVERYFGREVARKTAYVMEYQGEGWVKPDSNAIYARVLQSTANHPICPVCSMEVDPEMAPKSVFKGKTYFFCMPDHKERFDAAPEKWLA
ncbi:MAG TPA: DJ-1/PfpI family protein [Thermoanaerobaculia bacterium]|nr:DJ-1/PfpI family protein [Thermoanaerobaculia bacterium]